MTFDPFGDFDTEGYLQNSLKLKDPLEVKESEHLAFEASPSTSSSSAPP